MANKRIDAPSGTETVGHEWDGIEELDTPLPRWWVLVFIACIIFSIAYVIAYPAIPLRHSATPGVIGWSSRGDLAAETTAELTRRGPILASILATPAAALPENPELLRQAIEGGRAAFKVHCVQCHGAGAAGSVGYPNLNDDDWLWGGDMAAIETTLVHGIRNPDYDTTRQSQMPAFGEILSKPEIATLVTHVRSLSGQAPATAAGAALFETNCAACHGAEGKGNRELGAPNLSDAIWLYGGDPATLTTTIVKARAGVMPRWNARLDAVTIRMLAAYVHSLGGGEANPAPAVPEAVTAASAAASAAAPAATATTAAASSTKGA